MHLQVQLPQLFLIMPIASIFVPRISSNIVPTISVKGTSFVSDSNFSDPVSIHAAPSTLAPIYNYAKPGENSSPYKSATKIPYNPKIHEATGNLHPFMNLPFYHQNEYTNPQNWKSVYYANEKAEVIEEEMKEPPEIEDKVFSKTIVATKALTIGQTIFASFLILVAIILAVLSQLGTHLPPIIFPLALLPVGVITLGLFIPLFSAFFPFTVAGLAGGEKRRRRRFIGGDTDSVLKSLEANVCQLLDHWPDLLISSLNLQKHKDAFIN